MKRKSIAFILILTLCMAVMQGCGTDRKNEVDSGLDSQPTPAAESQPTPEAPEINYEEIYKPILDEYYDVIKNPYNYDSSEEGKMGVIENAEYLNEVALDEIGYLIKDINNDGVSELIIGASNEYAKNDIYALFTVKDSKPYYVLEGRSRSSYALIEGGKLYHSGSNGAAYSIFGIYELKPGGELACVDFYFSDFKDSNYTDIGFFHNTTGVYEKSEAEDMNITDDEFFAINEAFAEKTVKIDFIPFSNHKSGAESEVPVTDPAHGQMTLFISNWEGTAYTNDGNEWKLFLNILPDGSAEYRCGPPESEILADYDGMWNFDPTYGNLTLNLTENNDGSGFNGVFKLISDGSSLSLKHLSGNTFLYGTEGKTFNFALR